MIKFLMFVDGLNITVVMIFIQLHMIILNYFWGKLDFLERSIVPSEHRNVPREAVTYITFGICESIAMLNLHHPVMSHLSIFRNFY